MQLKFKLLCMSLFCIALLFHGARSEDENDNLEDCCSDGEYWLYENCIQPSEYTASEKCIIKAKECCAAAKKTRDDQCSNGLEIAKRLEDCGSLENDEANKCCETCKVRMSLGKTMKCEDKSDTYYSCCVLGQEEATEPTTTEKISTLNTPRAIVSDPDACDLMGNELCAHKCEPNDSSYVCTCRPGFKLRPDRHSCMKTGTDRCLKNNPCQHKCTDTGDALICSCHRGFELLEDNVSCIDIDECAIETHKCRSGKICVNTVGSHKCVDDPSLPKTETKPRNKINCPPGYKANKENLVCDDINECDQNPCTAGRICVNTVGSYTCSHGGVSHITPDIPEQGYSDLVPTEEICPPGFRLHPEIADCVDIDECVEETDDCNRKSQFCLNIQGSFFCQNKASKTTCPPGYKIVPEKGCVDIDECAENPDVCTPDSICVNDPGSYDCKAKPLGGKTPVIFKPPIPGPIPKPTPNRQTNPRNSCPKGYRRSYNGGCVDIDECADGTHSCDGYQECRNTLGSHRCDCRIGFEKDPLTLACIDINECQYPEKTNCVDGQRCDNTAGSYQCLRYTSCGTGYTLNAGTGLCEDDDECQSGTHNCDMLGPKYECLNIRGTFRCIKKPTSTTPSTTTESEYYYYEEEVDEVSSNTTNQQTNVISETYPRNVITTTEKVQIRYTPMYTPPREYPRYTPPPRQVPETIPRTPPTPPSTPSLPTPPLYDPRTRIQSETLHVPPSTPRKTVEIKPDQEGKVTYDVKKLPENTLVTFVAPSKHCIPGFVMNQRGECVDVDECALRQFTCNPETEICQNTQGGYTCICAPGYLKETSTNICRKIEERVPPPPPPFVPEWRNVKRNCDIGYEVDPSTNECVDIDECKDGTTRCSKDEVCQNTQGGYACLCAPGFILNQGRCQSIEPIRFTPPPPRQLPPQQPYYISPPTRVVKITKPPITTSRITCPRGYRLSDDESRCTDIDECAFGVHSCAGDQQCINVPGGYLCRCAPGHKVSPQGVCVDVDECTEAKGRVCSQYATCMNTIGSYRCDCKDGFTLSPSPQQMCTDINECEPNGGVGPCQHKCINTWGAYRCACNKGFRLQNDNRTCIDFDECGDPHRRLCVGQCVNTMGSYECGCPKGYRLGNDHRNCLDIDECENGEKVCGPEEVCQNVRGGARCTSIACPEGYVRDTGSKHRCKRINNFCLYGDIACQKQPNTYSYNFITFVSKLFIPAGPKPQVDLFTMKGPSWPGAKLNFNLRLVQARAPPSVEVATLDCFSLTQSTQQALVALLKPLVGPQEIHLELSMELYTDRMFEGTAVAKIFIYVSEYEF